MDVCADERTDRMTTEFNGNLTPARRDELEMKLLEEKFDILRKIKRMKADLQTERDRLDDVEDALLMLKEGV